MVNDIHVQQQLAERRTAEFEEILISQKLDWEKKVLHEQEMRIALEKQCSELQIWKTRQENLRHASGLPNGEINDRLESEETTR